LAAPVIEASVGPVGGECATAVLTPRCGVFLDDHGLSREGISDQLLDEGTRDERLGTDLDSMKERGLRSS
jgi:hypothetical protein